MTSPTVELHFNPTDLRPRDLPSAGAFLGSPAEALETALAMVRARMVAQMKAEVRGLVEPTYGQLLRLADLTWQLFLPQYRKVSAPVIADAYVRAWVRVDAGDVPMSVIYDLAEKHAEKVGDYFHDSSRDALAEGFNTMVNRRVPAKAAADKVLDAYGLTPRQMRGYANNKQLVTAIDSPASLDVKARSRDYIDRSFTGRVRKLSEQEEHNIEEQAKQFAWMWLQDKGRLTERAQKIWITARDERVCPVCGPLHGQKVLVREQFKTPQGDFWSPGVHPNCRCVVRMIENRFRLEKRHDIAKAEWDAKEHPRGGDPENPGRFSRVLEREREAPIWGQLKRAMDEAEEEPEEVPEEPMINITQGLINIAPKRRPAREINIAPQAEINIAPAEISIAQPTISIAPEQKMINITGQPSEIRLVENPEIAVEPAVQPEAKPDLAPMDTTFLLARDARPFYAVIHASEYDSDMNLGHTFTNSKSEVASIVTEQREARIDELLDTITGAHRDKPVTVRGEDPDTGEWMSGQVSAADFEHALRRRANHTQPMEDWDEMELDEGYEDVIWFNAEGHRVSEDNPSISHTDLLDQAGVHQDEFAYKILEVRSGHRDENETRPIGPGKFLLSGHFVEEGPTTSYLTDNEDREIPIVPMKPYG